MSVSVPVQVRDLESHDEPAWRALWDGYLRFYEHALPEEITHGTWQRLLTRGDGMFCRVAEQGEQLLGFVHCVVHASTWKLAPSCYLEDLFVSEQARGRRIGRMLIEDVLQQARDAGWTRVYWHTHRDNGRARSLYDTFISADPFVRYRLALS